MLVGDGLFTLNGLRAFAVTVRLLLLAAALNYDAALCCVFSPCGETKKRQQNLTKMWPRPVGPKGGC